MKILHVNSYELFGGAARAAGRLNLALQKEGLDSKLFVQNRESSSEDVIGPKGNIQPLLSRAKPYLNNLPLRKYKQRRPEKFSPSSVAIAPVIDQINRLNPDIVHLHWIVNGFIRIEDLKKIKAPIVWSLHDMWPFTGGCHYDSECERFVSGCYDCPVLQSGKKKDLSYHTFKRKTKTYAQLKNLTIVGLSKWLGECAKRSLLFKDFQIDNLPNPIDPDTYSLMDKQEARSLLNLNSDKKYILFGASDDNPRKGNAELDKALKELASKNYELLVLNPQTNKKDSYLLPAQIISKLNDDLSLKVLYNATDVMVLPSLQENLSNVIMESMACGTPVVAFDIGGNPDMIDHRKNGYLAKPFETMDLAKGISWVLENKDYKKISDSARRKVMEEFESKKVAKRYVNLYTGILENG